MYIKICEVCGKEFNSLTKWRRTCSDICLAVLKNKSRKENKAQKSNEDQICINCQRATGRCIGGVVCPWAHNLSVVPGWEAKKILLKEDEYAPYESYDIISCPLFLADEPKNMVCDTYYDWKALKDAILKYQGV